MTADRSLAASGGDQTVTGGAAEIVAAYFGWGHVRWSTTMPAREARLVDLPTGLPEPLRQALAEMDRTMLYSHQRETIEAVRAGQDVLLVTSTASGKTLAFNAAILDQLLRDPAGRALYIYPLNALANDQASALRTLVGHLPESVRPSVGLVTGQSSADDKLVARGARLVLTNPETLHFSILQRPEPWRALLGQLRFVVIDEAHMYRGAFGAHVSHVLRRLLRLAGRQGVRPQLIAASATIGNPQELGTQLTGRNFTLLDGDGSARPERQLIVWEPPLYGGGGRGSYETEAVQLFIASLVAGRSALLFARSRRSVEGLTADIQRQLRDDLANPALAAAVQPYRGGFTGAERKAIEDGLRGGSVRGVVTTNALEVGIDIGSLDVVIIAGYPGTMMAFWQQAGRAGRRGRTSQVFYVPSANPLDEYFAEDPGRLLETPHEFATFDPWNPRIAVPHVVWRAMESPIRSTGPWESPAAQSITERLAGKGALQLVNGAYRAAEPLDYEVSLRSVEGRPFRIVDEAGRMIGDVDEQYLYRECHPGAVYVHQGRSHRVEQIDEVLRQVVVRKPEEWITETRATLESSVAVTETLAERRVGQQDATWSARLVRVRVSERYAEFTETLRENGALVGTYLIEPPLTRIRPTVSLLIELPSHVSEEAAHAIEHALQAMVPTEVMCDRRDFVGLTESGPIIHLYDRNVDGLGFAERAFERLPAIAAASADRVGRCGCPFGCPLCIQSATCERWNRDLEKDEASRTLDDLLGIRRDRTRRPSPVKADRQSTIRDIAHSVADGLVHEQRAAAAAAISQGIAQQDAVGTDEGWTVSEYPRGLSVRHAAFGSGTVVGASAGRYGPEVDVLFLAGGQRRRIVGGVGYLVVRRVAS